MMTEHVCSTLGASSYLLLEAATAVLDQHHRYTEPELAEFLTDNFPDLPVEQ